MIMEILTNIALPSIGMAGLIAAGVVAIYAIRRKALASEKDVPSLVDFSGMRHSGLITDEEWEKIKSAAMRQTS